MPSIHTVQISLALAFTLSLPVQAQVPIECPDEGRTEIAAPGRHADYSPCGVTTISFDYTASLDGQIKLVGAGVEGAIHFEQTTPSQCKDSVHSYSDTLAKCQGLSVEGQFCKSNAYDITEKVYESTDLDPCPSQNLLDWIIEFIASGGDDWPGCSPLVETATIVHHSAQQYNCIGQGTGTSTAGFILVQGDPTAFVASPSPNQTTPLEALIGKFLDGDLNSLPSLVQGFQVEPIDELDELTVDSRMTWFDSNGSQVASRRRTLYGVFDSQGRFRFECPQLAVDEASGESLPFVESWTRDDRALYQWIAGQNRGMINPIQQGLADEYQRLAFPEIAEIQGWMRDPFQTLRGLATNYSVSSLTNGGQQIAVTLGSEYPFQRASRSLTMMPGNVYPSESELLDANGGVLLRKQFSEYRAISPGIIRPMHVEVYWFDRDSGALSAIQTLNFRSAQIAPAVTADYAPPTPPNNEWNLELFQ